LIDVVVDALRGSDTNHGRGVSLNKIKQFSQQSSSGSG
jgi:hypothetical protein